MIVCALSWCLLAVGSGVRHVGRTTNYVFRHRTMCCSDLLFNRHRFNRFKLLEAVTETGLEFLGNVRYATPTQMGV